MSLQSKHSPEERGVNGSAFLVDDDSLFRDALGHLLRDVGYECAYAESTAQGQGGASCHSLRALCHIRMPAESGSI